MNIIKTIFRDNVKLAEKSRLYETQPNRLSTNFFENKVQYEGLPYDDEIKTIPSIISPKSEIVKYDVMNNVCLCMIDIVGFSAWCSNQIPYVIAKSMLDYNAFICNSIKKYEHLKKIELVGDSCMIISGYNENSNYKHNCLNCIRFAVDMIKNVTIIQNIFKSKYIGIRIGVHLSDVIGVYVDEPQKYQMFGNDINICSRLESSTKPNTLHISEKTLMVVQEMCSGQCGQCGKCGKCGPCTTCVKGDCIKQEYKGVGTKTSYIYYLKKDKPLFVNFDIKSAQLFAKSTCCSNYDFDLDISLSITNFQSYKYICVYINLINLDIDSSIKLLEEIIEMKTSTLNQYVILLFQDNELLRIIKNRFPFTFDHYLNVTEDNYSSICTQIYDLYSKSFENKRWSLDLNIYENDYQLKQNTECNH